MKFSLARGCCVVASLLFLAAAPSLSQSDIGSLVRFIPSDHPGSGAYLRATPTRGQCEELTVAVGGVSEVADNPVVPVDLDSACDWSVVLVTESAWAAPVLLRSTAIADGLLVPLKIWPASVLRFALRDRTGVVCPSEARFRFSPRSAAAGADFDESFAADCVLAEDRCECRLPSAALDLRLTVDKYAPAFLWGLPLDAHPTHDLGPVELHSGASLAGWVEVQGRIDPAAQVRVTLQLHSAPAASSPAAEADESFRGAPGTVRVDSRGFFQFFGLEPGAYQLLASYEGFRDARLDNILIKADDHRILDSPLLLTEPATLTIILDPPVSPDDSSWELQLVKTVSKQRLQTLATETATDLGDAEFRGVPPGAYDLRVIDRSGSIWLNTPVELASGPNSFLADIDVVPIEGSVTTGGEPLRAEVWIGGRFFVPSLHFVTDESGDFRGAVPHEGEWRVDVGTIDQSATFSIDSIDIRRRKGKTIAEVDIELPNTVLAGSVVNDEGEPVAKAEVQVVDRNGGGGLIAQIVADEKGQFEVRGLSPSLVSVQATAAFDGLRSESDWQVISLQEDIEASGVTLIVQEMLEIGGIVRGERGTVPRATISLSGRRRSGGPSTGRVVISSHDGTFRLSLPAGSYHGFVDAPGYALELITVDPEEAAVVGLDLNITQSGGRLIIDLVNAAAAGLLGETNAADVVLGFQNGAQVLLTKFLREAPVEADESQRLILPMMRPGSYSLCFPSSTGEIRCGTAELVAGGEAVISVDAAGATN